MAEQLRKLKDGKPYKRPPSIEKLLDPALAQTPEVIAQRAYIQDNSYPDYLPTECLVHLFRHAFRSGNKPLGDVILEPLLKRCERILKNKILDDEWANAEELRENVLDEFVDLLAKDAHDSSQTILDYYEIHFNDAFCKLRLSFLRSKKNTRVCLPLTIDTKENSFEIDPKHVKRFFNSSTSSPEDALKQKELWETVDALPPDERKAIVLFYRFQLKVESNNPQEETIASRCGVSGRMIRTRLKNALETLRPKFQEEL